MVCPMDDEALSVRPQRHSLGGDLGVDEALIKQVVHRFYERVREDEILGPIFNHHVVDWEEHLEKLCAFWSSVILTTGRYKGTPMQEHVRLSQDGHFEIGEVQFERWLALFAANAHDVCDDEVAKLFIDRANRIASSLQMAINLDKGRLLG